MAVPTSPNVRTSASSVREAQRLETRARLFDAAVAEIGRTGLASADVSTIARTVGVVRGTFYFHFPTKEHVLVELQHAEEAKIVGRLQDRAASSANLESALTDVIGEVLAAGRRLGEVTFRDMLGLVFSATRPADDQLDEHPLAEYVIEVIAKAQRAGQVSKQAEPREYALIFLTGMFALLTTRAASPGAGSELLDLYVKTIVSGIEVQ